MSNQPKVRIVVPAAVAIMLTFGRGGMIPFLPDSYNMLDQMMNIFVLGFGTAFALKEILQHPNKHSFHRLVPIILFWAWISIVMVFMSSSEYWPHRTLLITIGLSILLCSQVYQYELRRVRLFFLLIGVVYCICLLIYAQQPLKLILRGRFETRLGLNVSQANVLLYPRMLYMLVLACIVTMLIEKSKTLKLIAAAIIPLPALIALSTAGRGALFGLVFGAFAFICGLRKKIEMFIGAIILGIVSIIGYHIVLKFVPLMQERLQDKGIDRPIIWKRALQENITLIGTGIHSTYPHNIFIECLINYGIIGFTLFILVLSITMSKAWNCYSGTRDKEVLWIISMIILQMTAQQFSLDIFMPGGLWAILVLPLGLGLMYRSPQVS
jgi:O-antigen ligase